MNRDEAPWVPDGWDDVPRDWATRPVDTGTSPLPDLQTLVRVARGEFRR